jgi:hypothetical protein
MGLRLLTWFGAMAAGVTLFAFVTMGTWVVVLAGVLIVGGVLGLAYDTSMVLGRLLRRIPRSGHAAAKPQGSAGAAATPDKPLTSAGATPLIKAKGTNDTNFPRIESAVDSFGHEARRTANGDLFVDSTDKVLRPGQQVTFKVEASDPNGDDLRLEVLRSGGGTGVDVTIREDGQIVWNVSEQDIADPARMHIYLTSLRTYHKVRNWDDSVTFTYRVLPRA